MTHTASNELITTAHAARFLGLSEGTIRNLARRGILPCVRVSSGLRLFAVSDLQTYRENKHVEGGRG